MRRSVPRQCSCGARLARDNSGTLCSACQRSTRQHPDAPPTVPPDFWSAEPIQRSLREWHMGQVIAAYRTHPYHSRPLPQERVASWLGITQAQLSRIENGDRINDLARLTDWARRLGIPPHLLWFKLPGSTTPIEHAVTDPDAPAVQVSELAEHAAGISMRFARTTAETGLAADTIDHLRWEIERLASDYVHVPLHTVFSELIVVRDTVVELLGKRHRPGDARELYEIAAIICDLLAVGSLDSNNPRAARSQLHAAWTCAQICDDDGLRAWIQGTAAMTEYWAGRPERASEHVRRGLSYRPSTVSRIRLAASEARIAARLGDQHRTVQALTAVHRAQDEQPRQDSLSRLAGAFDFPEARQHYYRGTASFLVGDYAWAIRSAEQAVALYQSGPPEERSYGDETLARIDLVNSHLAAGDLDAANDAVAAVLALPTSMRLGPIFTALRTTQTLLSDPRLARATITRSLRERLSHFEQDAQHQPVAAVS